jgi:hypothetical protein
MIPVLIIAGLFGLWLVVEEKQKAMTAKPISSGISVGVSPGAVSVGQGIAQETSTDTEVDTGLADTAKATQSIPVVGQLAGIAASIAGLFTQEHAAAVAKEAETLNSATPTFLTAVETTMADLNEGAISPSQAISYLQQAQQNYYTTVSSIIKKGGPCVASCVIGGQSTTGKPAGWVSTSPVCCNNSGTCNASCCIGCYLVEPTVTKLTAIINSGGGSYTVPSSQDNGAIQGTPTVTITYTPYTAETQSSLLSQIGSLF